MVSAGCLLMLLRGFMLGWAGTAASAVHALQSAEHALRCGLLDRHRCVLLFHKHTQHVLVRFFQLPVLGARP
ncbi:hypothetical protein COO60DRAFT_1490796 [Scenedesmus sp. NREL 46B-D3]|nr:hypothetical protein COO60DRAFT_1490796 [Scenedesmus sp. NREL 46B-D3]